jgi:hypothetical protein
VYAQDQVAWNYFWDDNRRLYFEFPSTWTVNDDKGIIGTGDGASLQLFGHPPAPGTVFPSSNTPFDQIINNEINYVGDGLRLQDHAPFSIQGMGGAYWLSYLDDSKGEQMTVDRVLLLNDGTLYRADFTVPSSLYEDTKSIRDRILTSIRVNDGYDNKMAEVNALTAQMQELQAKRDKMWADNDKFIADARQNMWDNVINNLQESTQADIKRGEDMKKYYDECDQGIRPGC